MQQGDMRIPCTAGVASSSKQVVCRQTQVVRTSFVHEGERARRRCIPSVSRNQVERALQLRLERLIHPRRLRFECPEFGHLAKSRQQSSPTARGFNKLPLDRLLPVNATNAKPFGPHRRTTLSSEPMRDPRTDPLITPANSALVVIDYQPNQINTVKSMDTELLVRNIVSVARVAKKNSLPVLPSVARLGKAYGLPVVLSTVNAAAGQGPTLRALKEVMSDNVEIDRTQINSWEDVEFRKAVEATGRKKLIMCALWTEVCLAFPALDALRAGYEVFPVVDAVGGTSVEAHRAGLERIVKAGAQPISLVSLACELQRDWARTKTVPAVVDIVLTSRLLKGV